jgi:ER membrane protein complex subunit 7
MYSGIPSGSYIVSVISPLHVFEPVRVDINTKGKIRARKVNFLQPGEVVTMKYPLNFETHGIPNYFQKREVYRLTDVIMNPMFLTLLVPLALLLILPKLAAQDPDMQRDLQNASSFLQPNLNTPDMGDFFANLLGGPKKPKTPTQQQLQNNGASSNSLASQQKRKNEALNKRRN